MQEMAKVFAPTAVRGTEMFAPEVGFVPVQFGFAGVAMAEQDVAFVDLHESIPSAE